MPQVKILNDSLNSSTGTRFTTFLVQFPKVLLAELNTHRMLVRSAGSSRAVTLARMIDKVTTNPFIPQFTLNQKGMAGNEDINSPTVDAATTEWFNAIDSAVLHVNTLAKLKIHKQNANRLLDSFAYVDVVLSGTEWDNFFKLRTAPDAQPEFRVIAVEMRNLYGMSRPVSLQPGEWHIPFNGYMNADIAIHDKLKVSVARCARTSYQTHEGEYSVEADLTLYDRLVESKHLSPFEHVAIAAPALTEDEIIPTLDPKLTKFLFNDKLMYRWTRNYAGFYTYRHQLEDNNLLITN